MLFLLAHTSVHALIIAIAIGIVLCCEYVFGGRFLRPLNQELKAIEDKRSIWIGFGLIGVGILTAVLQLNPPPDTGFAVGWNFNYDTKRVNDIVKLISRAYLPIPRPVLGFWGSNILTTYPFFQAIQVPLCYFLMLLSVLLFLKRPTALVTYLISTFGLLTFFYVKYHGSIRHHGFLFLTFLMCCWIYRESPTVNFSKVEQEGTDSTIDRVLNMAGTVLVTVLLICHAIGGIIAIKMEHRYIFSYGKLTAEYIKSQGMQDHLIVAEKDPATSTVVGYLPKRQVYYPRGSRLGSFVRWDKARDHSVSKTRAIQEALKVSRQHSQDVLLLLNFGLDTKRRKQYNLSLLAKFTGSTVSDEGFHLFLMPAP